MEEGKIIKIDRITYSAVSEVIESCADVEYLSNPGGLENLLPDFQKMRSKYPYQRHEEVNKINQEDSFTLVEGLNYMVNIKDDWDILQINKSDGQRLIELLKSDIAEIKYTDWLSRLS